MADIRIIIQVDPRRAKRGAREVERAIHRVGRQADRTRQLIGQLFTFTAVIAGIRSVIRVMAQFSQAIATTRAISSATAAQFQALSDEAKRLGATTRFTAAQVAEGMTFIARAGFNASEILQTVHGTLLLAQAGALDLGRAADIATNVLTGFRLEASETARVVDVLALATNRSNTNVQQLGDALKFVAPVAAGLGLSLETTTAAVGALSNAGLQASIAGTGLRRVLTELESPTPRVARIFKGLGVDIQDVRVSTVGLVEAVRELRSSGVNTALAIDIFQERGGPAFEVLSSLIDFIEDFDESLQNAEGTVVSFALVMDDNLNGAILRVRSAWEGLILSFGDAGPTNTLTNTLNSLAEILRALSRNIEIVTSVFRALVVLIGIRLVRAVVRSVAAFGAANRTALLTSRSFAAVRAQAAGASLSFVGVGRSAQAAIPRLAALRGQSIATTTALIVLSRTGRILARSFLALVGGPLGLIALVVLGIVELANAARDTSNPIDQMSMSIDEFRQSLENLNEAQRDAIRLRFEDQLGRVLTRSRALEDQIQSAEREAALAQGRTVRPTIGFAGGAPIPVGPELGAGANAERERRLIRLRGELADTNSEVDGLIQRLRSLDNFGAARPSSLPQVGGLSDSPTAVEVQEAEKNRQRLTRIRTQLENDTAQLTMDRISVVLREESQAAAQIRQLGENRLVSERFVQNALVALGENTRARINRVLEEEQNQINAVIVALENELELVTENAERSQAFNQIKRLGIELDSEAAQTIRDLNQQIAIRRALNEEEAAANRRNAKAIEEIGDAQLALLDAYPRQIVEIERWRIQTLANLDRTQEGYAELRAALDAVVTAQREAAQSSRDEARERALQELAQQHARSLLTIHRRQVQLGLATRDTGREAELWAVKVREGIDLTRDGAEEALNALDEIVERQRILATGDIFGGIQIGLESVFSQIGSLAEQVRNATVNAFQTMEQALTDFARTGKFSFTDLVNSILADLARIVFRQRILGPLLTGLAGALSGAFLPGRNAAIQSLGQPATSAGRLSLVPGFGGFRSGGMVRGPGGPRSDRILARVSNGEFVVNAAATRAHLGLLQNINRSPRFQSGGYVGGGSPPAPVIGSGPVPIVQIFDQRTVSEDSEDVEVQHSVGQNGEPVVRVFVRDAVRQNIREGEFDSAFRERFGIRPGLVRR